MINRYQRSGTLATKEWVIRAWDQSYENAGADNATAWEMNPLNDLAAFVKNSRLRTTLISSILEIGCGRGLRGLILLLGCSELNVPSLRYRGLDASKTAIRYANTYLEELRNGTVPRFIAPYLESAPEINCDIAFTQGDVFRPGPILESSYDLVIDWMCFHELPQQPEAYAELIGRLTNTFFILKAFEADHSSLPVLRPVIPNVPKRQFSRRQVSDLFRDYQLLYCELESENLNPQPPPADDIIAAKTAYLFVKKPRDGDETHSLAT